jgi:hypothetical protein
VNTLVCVLKSGVFKPWTVKDYTVQYGPHHVQWLRDQFAAQLKTPHRFICLTDMEVPGVETRPLRDDLPGWWSKLEIFREFDSASYVDLDSVVIGDISPWLFNQYRFLMSAHLTKRHGVNSSVMSWNGSMRWLYEAFKADKERIMKTFVVHGRWGDQDFIRETYTAKRGPIDKFQHHFPETILSYKHDILNKGMPLRFGSRKRVPLRKDWLQKPRLVCFHGAPKPYEIDAPWVPKLCAA